MPGLYPDAPRGADVVFTESARELLVGARAEADRLRHEYIGTEHLVLAMTQDVGGSALLRQFGVDGERVRASMDAIVRPGQATLPPGAERPYTSRTRQAFGLAAESAGAQGHVAVGTSHLIVGLLRERVNIGAQVLQQLGLSIEQAELNAQREDRSGSAKEA